MSKGEVDPLERLRRKALEKKPILWLAFAAGVLVAISVFLSSLATITDFFGGLFATKGPSVSIVTFDVVSNECIFMEQELYPNRQFRIASSLRSVINDLYMGRQNDDYLKRAQGKIGPAVDHLFSKYRDSGVPMASDEVTRIFQEKNTIALLRLLAPMDAKSADYEEFNEARAELFSVVAAILTEDSMRDATSFEERMVKPYRPLMMGRMRPVFHMTLQNDGRKTALINEVGVDLLRTRGMLAPSPSVTVIMDIVDVSLPTTPGLYSARLTPPIQIPPKGVVTVPVRILATSEGLYHYSLKLFAKGPGVLTSTDEFGIEM